VTGTPYFFQGKPLIRGGKPAMNERCCCVDECCCGPCIRFRFDISGLTDGGTCAGCVDANGTYITGEVNPVITDGVCVYNVDVTPDPNPLAGCEDFSFSLKAKITCPVEGGIRVEASVQIGLIIAPSPAPGEPSLAGVPHFILDEVYEDCDDFSEALARSGTLSNICGLGDASVTLSVIGCDDLVGGVNARSIAEGTLSAFANAEGAVSATSTLTGRVAGDFDMSGEITATSAVDGMLTALASGEGSVSGASSTSATITALGNAKGDISGTSTLAGSLVGFGTLLGEVDGTSTVAGTLTALGSLEGSVSASSTLTGRVAGDVDLSGSVTGTSTVEGTLSALGNTSGEVTGTSGTLATITAIGNLAGEVTATSTITGELESCCCGDCIVFRYTISGLANAACDSCNDYNTDNDSPPVNPDEGCVYSAQWESSDCDGQKIVFIAELICDDDGDVRLSGSIQDTALVGPLIDPPGGPGGPGDPGGPGNGPTPTNDIMKGTDTFESGTPCNELEITLSRDTGTQTTCDFDNATVVLKVVDCPQNEAVIKKLTRKARKIKARKLKTELPICQHRGEELGKADCQCAGKPMVWHCTLLDQPCIENTVGKPITKAGNKRISSPVACSLCDHFEATGNPRSEP
jgi:hypothetical protein